MNAVTLPRASVSILKVIDHSKPHRQSLRVKGRGRSRAAAATVLPSSSTTSHGVFLVVLGEAPPARRHRAGDQSAGGWSKIDKNTFKLCQIYDWPGNIRELQNIIERSVIFSTGDTFWIDEGWLSSPNARHLKSSGPLTENLRSYEKQLIESALAASNGKVAGSDGAAAKLGTPRSTLDARIKQLKITKYSVR
jgi:hypothetical protein